MCSLLSLSAFILSLFISLVSAFWGEKQLFIFVSGAQFDTRCQMMCQNVHNLPYAGPAKSYLMSRWAGGQWVVAVGCCLVDFIWVALSGHCGVKCVRD